MRIIKNKKKIKKNNTYLGIVFTDPQMCKKVSKPFDGELCGSKQPADYNSLHIKTYQ